MSVFTKAIEASKALLCYNGDLFTVEEIQNFQKKHPQIENIMLGRGILKTPSLLEELQGKSRNYRQWYEFLSELCEAYEEELSGDRNVIFKMKELWFYMFQSLPDNEKAVKAMRKVKDLAEYKMLVRRILY